MKKIIEDSRWEELAKAAQESPAPECEFCDFEEENHTVGVVEKYQVRNGEYELTDAEPYIIRSQTCRICGCMIIK